MASESPASAAVPAPDASVSGFVPSKDDVAHSSVDLLILMDVTGSMGAYIEAAKETCVKTANEIRAQEPNAKYRIGFVGYRDLGDADRLDIIPFTEDVEAFQAKLAPVKAWGGADTAEDVAGGLHKALDAEWRAHTCIIMMVADAPGHGRDINGGCDDNYPDGDPSGLNPCSMLNEIATRGYDFYFMRCASNVDAMVAAFSSSYETGRQNPDQIFSVLDLAPQGYPAEAAGRMTGYHDIPSAYPGGLIPVGSSSFPSSPFPSFSSKADAVAPAGCAGATHEESYMPESRGAEAGGVSSAFSDAVMSSVKRSLAARKG